MICAYDNCSTEAAWRMTWEAKRFSALVCHDHLEELAGAWRYVAVGNPLPLKFTVEEVRP